MYQDVSVFFNAINTVVGGLPCDVDDDCGPGGTCIPMSRRRALRFGVYAEEKKGKCSVRSIQGAGFEHYEPAQCFNVEDGSAVDFQRTAQGCWDACSGSLRDAFSVAHYDTWDGQCLCFTGSQCPCLFAFVNEEFEALVKTGDAPSECTTCP